MDELKYPKNERVWVSYYNKSNELRYIITSKDSARDSYTLYELAGNGFKKLGTSASPRELEERFHTETACRS